MQQTFTHEFMQDNCGCYSEEPGKLESCSFMSSDPVTLVAILDSEIPLKDKYWFVCKKLATKEQNQQIAITVSEMVLPIWEAKHPDDKRPHEAIEAAKQYIAGHISIGLLIEKRQAAAYAAAYAADAADDEIKTKLLNYLKEVCLNPVTA